MNELGKQLYEQYTQAYDSDPFAEETIQLGEALPSSLATEYRERWEEMISNTDMTKNSKQMYFSGGWSGFQGEHRSQDDSESRPP